MYIDIGLPFGLQCAPKIFNTVVADAVEWVTKSVWACHPFYLDDSLMVAGPNSTECAEHLVILLAIFKDLSIMMVSEKLEGLVANKARNK